LGRRAAALLWSERDSKLIGITNLVSGLLKEGFHPIVWCRYIATAEYVAEHLAANLPKNFAGVRVIALTGSLSDEERRAKTDEIVTEKFRVLVATDCLSEGINLQEGFNAAIHYGLPWNPNRLEQREGHVDRYCQQARINPDGKRYLESGLGSKRIGSINPLRISEYSVAFNLQDFHCVVSVRWVATRSDILGVGSAIARQ
jgi:hypothetical protein